MRSPLPATLALVVALVHPAPAPAADALAKTENVTVELLADVTAIRAGEAFTLAIHMTMAPQWHTYWKNPGDSGMPTRVVWTLPDGFQAGDLQWPSPVRAVDAGLALFGYEGEITFLAEVTPPPNLPPGRFSVGAALSWLECRDICIPAKAQLSVSLPSSAAAGERPLNLRLAPVFEAARASMPGVLAGLKGGHAVREDRLVLTLSGVPSQAEPTEFFPETTGLIDAAAAQTVTRVANTWEISMKRAANAPPPPDTLGGILVTGSGPTRKVYQLSSQ